MAKLKAPFKFVPVLCFLNDTAAHTAKEAMEAHYHVEW